MSSGTADACPSDLPKASSASTAVVHPRWVRITHWINVIAMFVMIASGWRIYDASPLFRFTFPPEITLGDGLQDALLWHFAAMWLLFVSTTVYIIYGLMSGHFRRSLLPVRPREVVQDLLAALRGRLAHYVGERNAVQKAMYIGVITVVVLTMLSGVSIWKPVQFQELTTLFGGYDLARYVHFLCMAAIVLFLAVHLSLTLLVPKVLPPMITGRARGWR